MSAYMCFKKHNTQGISSSGIDGKLFGYVRHDFYCPVCNKARSIYSFWLNIRLPKLFKAKPYEDDTMDDMPY